MSKLILLEDGKNPENILENFRRIKLFMDQFPFLKGEFKFFDLNLSATSYPATVNVAHEFSFIPKDIIPTYVDGSVSYTWQYAQFTDKHLKITISAAGPWRGYIGRYSEDKI